MMRLASRLFLLLALLAGTLAQAGTLQVTTPTQGQYLGQSNTLRFLLTGVQVEVTVRATITGPGGTIVTEDQFTPDSQNRVSNSLPLNFSTSSPNGDYTIKVEAIEPGNTYNTVNLNVKVDTTQPLFLSFTPTANAFVKGTVRIRAKLKELNLQRWEVTVDGDPIPNNSGNTLDVAVDWNADAFEDDGAHTIRILARDLAGNERTQSISVTLDRRAPVATIAFPRSDTRIESGTTIAVIVDVRDFSNASVDFTGVDVIARTMDGAYLTRVARVSVTNAGADTIRWTGRIRADRNLPRRFRIVVNVVDKAGNVGAPQEVIVNVR